MSDLRKPSTKPKLISKDQVRQANLTNSEETGFHVGHTKLKGYIGQKALSTDDKYCSNWYRNKVPPNVKIILIDEEGVVKMTVDW